MWDLFFSILNVIIEELRKRTALRTAITIVSGFLLIAATILLALSSVFYDDILRSLARDFLPGLIFASGFLTFVSLVSYTSIKFDTNRGSFSFELETLMQERTKINERISKKDKPDVLDTIQLSLNQLNEYYAINKSQARNSFTFSVTAVILGSITLLAGIWLFYFGQNPNIQISAISGIAGILIQFIGAAYFYLYRKSLTQLNFFFTQLVKMQDTMLSVRLCEQITPKARQNDLREKVIMTLLSRSSSNTEIPIIEEMKNSGQPAATSNES